MAETPNQPGADPEGLRPYEQTPWEAEKAAEVEQAVVEAAAQVRSQEETPWERRATDARDLVMAEIQASLVAVAEDTAKVEHATREALIAENARATRRNAILSTLVGVLLLAVGLLLYRDFRVETPDRDAIKANSAAAARAAESLDGLTEYVASVQGRAPDPATATAFRHLTELRSLVCATTDAATLAACAALTEGATP